MQMASVEYERFDSLLADLDGENWTRSTECAGWDVRTMASHVLGMAEMAASIPQGIKQLRAAGKRGGVFIDALTGVQVDQRAGMTPQQVADRFRVVAPRAARARRRTPGLIRNRRLPTPQQVGDGEEIWTLGYLVDTILTRDVWMHRVDIARAIAAPPHLTADHDGVLVANVVTEWAARHSDPCYVRLTGPAGGTWTFGVGGPEIDLDAVEFCRVLSGREPASGLLVQQVPF
jgi:uncharacterized protein (TIGR03083 family)